jgi:hypothetical protein
MITTLLLPLGHIPFTMRAGKRNNGEEEKTG